MRWLWFIFIFLSIFLTAAKPDSLQGFVQIKDLIPDTRVELKYATTDNFLHENVYGDFKSCYLLPQAAQMLQKAREYLQERDPSLTFVLYDCLRPVRVQKKMWEIVKDTPQKAYVANPYTKTGSIHNYGCAVDLSLWNAKTNKPLDMGTPFDHFGPEAEPQLEMQLLKQKKISLEQLANRLLLREVMVRAGFLPLKNEWWHFNCADHNTVLKNFRKVD